MLNRIITEGITLTAGGRDAERKLEIIATVHGGKEFKAHVWMQDKLEREKYLDKLCEAFPGIGTEERIALRDELEVIRKDHELDIDIHPPHPGKINGRGTCSIDYYVGSRIEVTESGNMLDSRFQRNAASRIADVAMQHLPGRRSREKLVDRIQRLILDEIKRLRHTPPPRSLMPTFDPNAPEKVQYELIDGAGMFWRRPTNGGEQLTRLTNFTARIVANIVRTDGVERTRDLEIEAALRGRAPTRFAVKWNEFEDMRWPMRELGGEASIEPEDGYARRARAAIQKCSTDVVQKVLYTHTGWMDTGDAWVYLHAGGIIGPAEAELPKIDVALSDALARYKLPAPPTDAAHLKHCVRASLRFLKLAAPHITYPLYAAIWRPLFGECGLSSFINGRTQSFKSEVMSLMCRHYAPAMHAKAFPGGWDSTLNYLRDMSFKLKDAPFPVDDFKPGVLKARDAAEVHKLAERFFRAQANMSERGRCDEFGASRGAKPPRGMAWATGEELPNGQSLRARLWITDLSPRDVDREILSLCQADAREGLFAGAMSGAIRWFATKRRIAEITDGFAGAIEGNRARAIEALERMHLSGDDLRRTCDNTLNLALAFRHFINFATDVRAITESEAAEMSDTCWAALAESAELQAKHQREEDPVSRFFRLLRSALSSGMAYVSAQDGSEPGEERNLACGYRKRGATFWEPGRARIGCYTPRCICLDTEASFRVANDVLGSNGDGIGVSSPTALGKHLKAKGFLVNGGNDDDPHGRRTDRRRIGGELRMVWCIAHDVLDIPGPDEGGVPGARTAPPPPPPADLADQSFDFGPESEEP